MLGKPVYSITPFSLLDYPNQTSCIIWYAGCNMRCPYCYNSEIVFGIGNVTFTECEQFLKKRKGLLDAVVFSGGECLIHKSIIEQIKEVKKMGFLVKIDTNGSSPTILEALLDERTIDYVALDFKSTREKFAKVTLSNLYNKFEKSLKLLVNGQVGFEVRTTFHSALLSIENLNEMVGILEDYGYQGNFYVQLFRNTGTTIGRLAEHKKISFNKLLESEHVKVVFR